MTNRPARSFRIAAIVSALSAAAVLSACSQSDETLADKIKNTTRASDIFANLCYKTHDDLDRVRHIATLVGWKPAEGVPFPSDAKGSAWTLDLQGNKILIVATKGPDDRSDTSTPGKPMTTCIVMFDSTHEPDYAKNIVEQVDLKKVDPSKFHDRPPASVSILSETGGNDGSLQIILLPSGGDSGSMGMATALRVD
jgi:hypothetical protein